MNQIFMMLNAMLPGDVPGGPAQSTDAATQGGGFAEMLGAMLSGTAAEVRTETAGNATMRPTRPRLPDGSAAAAAGDPVVISLSFEIRIPPALAGLTAGTVSDGQLPGAAAAPFAADAYQRLVGARLGISDPATWGSLAGPPAAAGTGSLDATAGTPMPAPNIEPVGFEMPPQTATTIPAPAAQALLSELGGVGEAGLAAYSAGGTPAPTGEQPGTAAPATEAMPAPGGAAEPMAGAVDDLENAPSLPPLQTPSGADTAELTDQPLPADALVSQAQTPAGGEVAGLMAPTGTRQIRAGLADEPGIAMDEAIGQTVTTDAASGAEALSSGPDGNATGSDSGSGGEAAWRPAADPAAGDPFGMPGEFGDALGAGVGPLGAADGVAEADSTFARMPAQIAAQIERAFRSGDDRLVVELHPAELGGVEIRLMSDADGRLAAEMIIDRPETLADMRRDIADLAARLERAGISVGENGLQFNLRQDNGDRGFAGMMGGERQGTAPASSIDQPDPPAVLPPPIRSDRLVDLVL